MADGAATVPAPAPADAAPTAAPSAPVEGKRPRAPRTDAQRARAAELARARRHQREAKEAKLLGAVPQVPEAAPAPEAAELAVAPAEKPVWPPLEDMTAAAGQVREGLAGLRKFVAASGVPSPMSDEDQAKADGLASMMLAPWACKVSADPNSSVLMRRVITPDALAVLGLAFLAWPYVGEHVVAAAKWAVAEIRKSKGA